MTRAMWIFEQDGDAPVYSVRLAADERAVLLDVVDDVIDLLGGLEEPGTGSRSDALHPLDRVRLGADPVPAPLDPAVRRLLPDASRDDPAVAAEFRRFTEGDVRAAKIANLLRLRAAVEGARPDALVAPSEGPAIAAALTDLRLVIAERLEIRTEEDADEVALLAQGRPPVDEHDAVGVARRFLATLYVVLGILQESLVELLLTGLPEPDDGSRAAGRRP